MIESNPSVHLSSVLFCYVECCNLSVPTLGAYACLRHHSVCLRETAVVEACLREAYVMQLLCCWCVFVYAAIGFHSSTTTTTTTATTTAICKPTRAYTPKPICLREQTTGQPPYNSFHVQKRLSSLEDVHLCESNSLLGTSGEAKAEPPSLVRFNTN